MRLQTSNFKQKWGRKSLGGLEKKFSLEKDPISPEFLSYFNIDLSTVLPLTKSR